MEHMKTFWWRKKCKATYWVLLFLHKNTAVHLGSLGIYYIPQELLYKFKDKSIRHNILRIRDDDSIMCGFYCIAFVEYMSARNTLLGYCILIFFNLMASKRMIR